jgi:2-polyprenyl-3-methyl-5-hydroxy-6-metoxy-1,4-benzoquinol methylase
MEFDDMKNWWNSVAEGNAKTAILSGRQVWTDSEFFQSGVDWMNTNREFASKCVGKSGPIVFSGDLALDFGCGIGRMTQALAESYKNVVGVDISNEMIAQAQMVGIHNNVNFEVVQKYPLPFSRQSFDMIFSTIVIQHIPQPHNINYVRELFQLAKHEGLVVFDAPSREELEEFRNQGVFFLSFGDILSTAEEEGLQLVGLRSLNFPNSHYQYIFQR